MSQKQRIFVFTEEQLRDAVMKWAAKEIASGHRVAIKQAQFVGQRMINMLCNAKELQTQTDISSSIHGLPTKSPDLNNMEEFKRLIGEDWDNLVDN